jgi:hypothetical protein
VVPPLTARKPRGAKNDRALSKAPAGRPLTTSGSSRGVRLLLAEVLVDDDGGGGARLGLLGGLPDREHLVDRGDPGDGVLGEAEAVGHGADELAVDINRTAAHAGDDAGRFEAMSFEPGQDDAAFGRGVLQDAEDLGVEVLDGLALKDALPVSLHARLDLGQGHGDGRRLR